MSAEETAKQGTELPDDSDSHPASADGTQAPQDPPQNPPGPPQDPPYQKPYWLRGGHPGEPVQPRPPSLPMSTREAIIARLASREKKGGAHGPQRDSGTTRKQRIMRRMRDKDGANTAPPHTDALLRARLMLDQRDPVSLDAPAPFSPHTSLPLSLKRSTQHVFAEPEEDGDGNIREPLHAILEAKTLAKDPLPHPAESPISDLMSGYEAAYGTLGHAIDTDPTAVTREQVRTFIAQTTALDIELNTAIAGYIEEYSQAAQAIMHEYLMHKNELESLVAIGERELEELPPDQEIAVLAYHGRVAEFRAQITEVKKAFFNFVLKSLAVSATRELLEEFIRTRKGQLADLETLLDDPNGSESGNLQSFGERCTQAAKATAALTTKPGVIPQYTRDIIAENILRIHRLLNSYMVPVFLADNITDNGVTFIRTPALRTFVEIDPDKVLKLNGVHLQALQRAGYDLNAWDELRANSGAMHHELALLRNLVDETLPVRAALAREPKHSISHPAPPNPPYDTASEPRQ